MKRKGFLVSLIVLLCFSLIIGLSLGCAGQATPTSTEKPAIKIGADFALTGPSANTTQPFLKGAQLAVDEINAKGGINGRRLELVVMDNKTDPVKVATDCKQLVESEKVSLIIGDFISTSSLAQKQFADANQFPIIASMAQATDVRNSNWFVAAGPLSDELVQGLLDRFKKSGFSRIANMYMNLAWGLSEKVQVEKYAAQYGLQLVASEAVDTASTDLTIQTTRMRDAKPDFIWTTLYQPNTNAFVVARNTLNWNVPFVLHRNFLYFGIQMVDPKLFENAYGYDRVIYTRADVAEMLDKYAKRYGARDSMEAVVGAWDTVQIAAAVLTTAGADLSPKSIMDAVAKTPVKLLQGQVGRTYTVSLPQRNYYLGLDDLALVRFVGGKEQGM